ncbi:MAG: tRNA (guanosine(37)-N1)-methyltransferase TrmD [Candidatus Paceibacterota bacterium]
MHFHIITLFPDVCRAYTDASILGRAQKTDKGKGAKMRGKKIEVSYYNPRDFSKDKHHKVDDKPYSGGPGMVMQAEPVLKAWDKVVGRKQNKKKIKTLIMSPRGVKFTQDLAKEYAKKYDHLVLISGRYEGIDYRVKEITEAEEVSVGDYILTGGELPALTIIDATARQIPGVLGEINSLEDERLTNGKVYTRPEILKYKKKEYKVPEVLLSGNPALIERWQREE